MPLAPSFTLDSPQKITQIAPEPQGERGWRNATAMKRNLRTAGIPACLPMSLPIDDFRLKIIACQYYPQNHADQRRFLFHATVFALKASPSQEDAENAKGFEATQSPYRRHPCLPCLHRATGFLTAKNEDATEKNGQWSAVYFGSIHICVICG